MGGNRYLIEVQVSVTDSFRRPVTGLSESHFRLAENGQPVALVAFFAPAKGARGTAAYYVLGYVSALQPDEVHQITMLLTDAAGTGTIVGGPRLRKLSNGNPV